MEQLQFDDNFAGEGFAPVTQIDYTKTLDRRNARLNRADQEALAQVQRNNQVRIQNAQDSGKGLKPLVSYPASYLTCLVMLLKKGKKNKTLKT